MGYRHRLFLSHVSLKGIVNTLKDFDSENVMSEIMLYANWYRLYSNKNV